MFFRKFAPPSYKSRCFVNTSILVNGHIGLYFSCVFRRSPKAMESGSSILISPFPVDALPLPTVYLSFQWLFSEMPRCLSRLLHGRLFAQISFSDFWVASTSSQHPREIPIMHRTKSALYSVPSLGYRRYAVVVLSPWSVVGVAVCFLAVLVFIRLHF